MIPFPFKGPSGIQVNNLLWRYERLGKLTITSVSCYLNGLVHKMHGHDFAVLNPKT